MKGKFLFIVGLAIGYVFGTRAGRKRYEQIKSAAQNIWESEPVQWSVKQAQDAVGDVAEEAITAAKRVIHQVTGDKPVAKKEPAKKAPVKKPVAPRPAAEPVAKTAPKPSAK
ncbi:putative membrane protein [Aurantimicrobium minutum]|uniref:YtxH domain-containing protein n=1 Tax=Aurantimicrobium minutum TaxID=708131 RepID=UPI00247590CB|nr:YtxH domain-containing protein [Aurantimicrobium minutum]MDH6277902.1 putative membrane protein [Aurantimicrobium minutum]